MGDIVVTTRFQIPPDSTGRCMFLNTAFNINDIHLITEPYMHGSVLCYKFNAFIGYSDEYKLEFTFSKKKEAVVAQRELARAWTKTGEFSDVPNEGVDSGESPHT